MIFATNWKKYREVHTLARRISHTPKHVIERNIALLEKLMRYLLAETQIFSALPDDFELVILPEDDPEIRLYNLELLDRIETRGKPIVLAQKSTTHLDLNRAKPHCYVSIAAS